MKDELNFSYNGGGGAYLLQSVAIHFNYTVGGMDFRLCTELIIFSGLRLDASNVK